MGYSSFYTNTFAITVIEFDENVEGQEGEYAKLQDLMDRVNKDFKAAKLNCELTERLADGGDSRIHGDDIIVMFKDYTRCTLDNIKGDVNGTPSDAEIAKVKAICDKWNIPWNKPERSERTYVY